jgi:hypothetical protein
LFAEQLLAVWLPNLKKMFGSEIGAFRATPGSAGTSESHGMEVEYNDEA